MKLIDMVKDNFQIFSKYGADSTATEKRMKPPNIQKFKDPKDLRTIMANAKNLGNDEVWRQAFQRLCEVEGEQYSDPLHSDFFKTLAAYEELLTIKNGRTTPATRTRQKLRNKGLKKCLEEWATDTKPTEGFKLLIENDMAHLTGEYLVLKYRDQFTDKAIESASKRLQEAGVPAP